MHIFIVKTPPKEWPDSGQIVFQNFHLRYSPDSPYVLKNLNFQIQPMEKVFKSSPKLFRLSINVVPALCKIRLGSSAELERGNLPLLVRCLD